MSLEKLKEAIRDIPDFPQKGVIFKDITTLINQPDLFREAINLMAARYSGQTVDSVMCIEARGFIFGAALAYRLGAGVIPVRKEGKLPHRTKKVSFELEYGSETVEIHEDAIRPGARILIVDDLLATGGTLAAAVELAEHYRAEILGIEVLIELDFLNGREKLKGHPLFALIHY